MIANRFFFLLLQKMPLQKEKKPNPDKLICQRRDFSDLKSVTFFCHQAKLLSWQVLHVCKQAHLCQVYQHALVSQERLIFSSLWVQHSSLGLGISLPFKHQPGHRCSVGPNSRATQLLTNSQALLNSSGWANVSVIVSVMWHLFLFLPLFYFYFYLLNTEGMKVSNPHVFCPSVQAVVYIFSKFRTRYFLLPTGSLG